MHTTAASSLSDCSHRLLIWISHLFNKILRFFELKRFWVSACALFLATYIAFLVFYTMYPGYVDHVEPNVASVAWMVTKGAPLYHDLGSAERYSLLYGPMTYLPYSVALRILGANILSLKLVVLGENLTFLVLLFSCYRKLLSPAGALLVTTGVIAYLMQTGFYFLAVRGDAFLVLLATLGLYAVLCASSRTSVFLLSLACGACFDVKFTGFVYFLPLYVMMLQQKHGRRRAAIALVGAVIVAAAPFFLSGISLTQYLVWLRVAGRHPLAYKELQHNLGALAALFAPVGLLLWRLGLDGRAIVAGYLNRRKRFLLTLGGCVAVMAILASKVGTGPHHFMAFSPLLGYVCSDLYRRAAGQTKLPTGSACRVVLPMLWSCLVLALMTHLVVHFGSTGRYSVATLYRERSIALSVSHDIEGIMRGHPGKRIEMGYGDVTFFKPAHPYEITYFRPALVFAGNPLTVDASALDDMQLSGITVPSSTIEYMRECRTEIWLIPKDSLPFTGLNVYSQFYPESFAGHPLFDNSFRAVFLQHYQKQETSKYFDLWECAAPLHPGM